MKTKDKQSWGYIAGGAVALIALTGVVIMLPEIVRYIKIKSM